MRSIEEIQKAVCDEFHIGIKDLTGSDREQTIMSPRHISVMICFMIGYTRKQAMEAHNRHENGFLNSIKSSTKILLESRYYRESTKKLMKKLA